MELIELGLDFSVCKLASLAGVELGADFTFLARTDDEISLVCESRLAPAGALRVEPGWRSLRIVGALDFSLVGIIAHLAGLLAGAGIAVFVASTFDTDYIFVKAGSLGPAIDCLERGGCRVARRAHGGT